MLGKPFLFQDISTQVGPGSVWTSRTSPTPSGTHAWTTGAYGNGLYMLSFGAGGPNSMATSTDGINWTLASNNGGNNSGRLVFGNISGTNYFVYIDSYGRSSYSTNNWASYSTYTGLNFSNGTASGFCSGNNYFVAVFSGSDGRYIYYSTNATTWTQKDTNPAGTGSDWSGVCYGTPTGVTGGRFVAVAAQFWGSVGANRIMTCDSAPSGTWTARTCPQNNQWTSVCWGNGTYVAVSQNGTNRVMTSPDGVTWTLQNAAAALAWNSVTYGNGIFVATANTTVSGSSQAVMTSTDGATWTLQPAVPTGVLNTLIYGNGKFVAAGGVDGTSCKILTSQ